MGSSKLKIKIRLKKILVKNANQINSAFMFYLNKKNTLKDNKKNIKISELINKALASAKN